MRNKRKSRKNWSKMLLAQQKQKENIAEYIIYMYQMEDIVRAFQFDLDKIVQ